MKNPEKYDKITGTINKIVPKIKKNGEPYNMLIIDDELYFEWEMHDLEVGVKQHFIIDGKTIKAFYELGTSIALEVMCK